MTTVKGRRRPPPVPALSKMSVETGMREIEKWLRALSADASGLPPTHEETHLVGGTDSLEAPGTPSTVTVNVAADAGDGPSFAREDHQHAVDLGLTAKGDLLSRTSSAYARLPVGVTDGQALIVASAETTGLKYGTPAGIEDAQLLGYLAIMGW